MQFWPSVVVGEAGRTTKVVVVERAAGVAELWGVIQVFVRARK